MSGLQAQRLYWKLARFLPFGYLADAREVHLFPYKLFLIFLRIDLSFHALEN